MSAARPGLPKRTASRGTLVYDERIIPITDIRLEGDELVIYGEMHGTLDARDARGVVVHSPEGKMVLNAPHVRCEMPGTYRGTVYIRQPIKMTDVG